MAKAAQQRRSISVVPHCQLQSAAVNSRAQPARQVKDRLQLRQQLAHLAAKHALSMSACSLPCSAWCTFHKRACTSVSDANM